MSAHARCLLCGARMTADQLLDACVAMVDPDVPALGARCPYCQGYFEVHPVAGGIEIGYRGDEGVPHFDVVQQLAIETLALDHQGMPERLVLVTQDRRREFQVGEVD